MHAPQKSETPLAGGAIAKQSTNTQIVANAESQRKAEATLAALFALHGHEVAKLSDGSYLIARWGLSRRCADLAELRAFAQRIGATE
jgi:hypothetical protein